MDSRVVLRAVVLSAALGLTCLPALAGAPSDGLRLGAPGTALPSRQAPADGDLSIAVAAPESPVTATHVLLRQHGSSEVLQRTADGFFVPGGTNSERLADTGARPVDGVLTFKILNEPLEGLSYPLTIVLIARTADGVLTGEFTVEPRR